MVVPQEETTVFREPWMEQCYHSLVYPNPSCVQVLEQVNRALATHVNQPQGSEFKQQALFTLLGPEFTTQYFPYHKYNVRILEPPLPPRQKEKYLREARVFLDQALSRALADCGYPEDVASYQKDDQMGRFLHDVRTSFREGLRRHTTVIKFQEEEEKHGQKDEKRKRNDEDEDDEDDDDDDDGNSNDTEDEEEGTKWKAQPGTRASDVAGQALLAFIAYDDTKKENHKKRLRARHLGLSTNLRRFFWWEYLAGREATRVKAKPGQDLRAIIRGNFDTTLAKEMKNQKVVRAIRSNNWRTIDNAVIEAYDNTSTLRTLDDDDHMIQTARALNILHIHSKTFSTSHIYWLLPLQQVFKQDPDEEDEEHVIRLGVQLELVRRHCQLEQKEVFKVAEQVVQVVRNNDPQYYDHISSCLATQVSRISLKDFPPEVLLKEAKASRKVYEELQGRGTKNLKPKQEKIFTNPAIFVRKWIAQGFAGVVSVTASLWVWDQLFLDGWKKDTVRDVAVSILVLIKPWMARANMYSGARKVLLEEPGKLYLSDLRRALAHLEAGGAYSDIPDNKNYLGTSKPPQQPPPKIQVQDTEVKEVKEKKEKPVAPKPDGRKEGPKSMPKTKEGRKEPTPESQPAPATSRSHGPAAVLPFAPDNLFRIDLNLDSDSDDDQPLPVPEPSPDTESDQDPTPVASPDLTPPPTPPPPAPPPEHLAWVPYEKNKTEPLLPAPTRVTDPCDLYIDAVRFLPDNITYCKVTGRVTNMYMSKDERVPDIVALPQLDSSTRCPSYRCKIRLNEGRVFLNANMTIVLRVYGYEKHLRHVAVVGACLIQVFDSSRSPPTLCVGGVQRRLRHGLPDPPAGLENLVSSDMDYHEPLPGASICVRLLPASQEYVEAPPYESGYYRSEECCPWTSERRLFRHYICRSDYRTNIVTTQLKEAQKAAGKAESTNDEEFQRYMEESLDWRAQQKRTKQPPPDIDYTHFVHYDIKMGLRAAVQGVFALPENLEGFYCHAYCRVLPGEGAKNLPEAPEGDGRPQHFITRTPDFLSYQRSPQWLDDPETLHLHYDERSILLVQVYGFLPKYLPGSGSSPGSLTSRDGSSIALDYNKPLAWTFTQIFDQGSVIGGVHWLPLMEGQPDPDLLATLSQSAPAHQVLATKKSRVKPFDGASLELKFWDGHLEVLDIIEGRTEALVKAMGKTEKYSKGQIETFSKTLDEFYLENMDGANKKDGSTGEKFDKEREFFESEANKEFFKAMNKALKDAGLPMLPAAP